MKTSNKLLLAAILIIIISMVTYDFALRAEYLKGTYKSPFYEMEKLNIEGFTVLDNSAANLISVQIKYGKTYGIYISKDVKDKLHISKKGNILFIDVADKIKPNIDPYRNSIIIVCPLLDKVITSSLIIKAVAEWDNYNGTTAISGFNQQDLSLIVNKSTSIKLEKNKIGYLQGLVGDSLTKNASLFIPSNNQINDAVIKVAGKNQLSIENPKISRNSLTISDSAIVNLGGSILKQLQHQ